MVQTAGVRLSLWAVAHLLTLVLAGALTSGACAQRTYQLPADSPPTVADRPDGGPPPPERSSRRGIIVPGDPASGTTQLGSSDTPIDTHTGTTGTRVTPGGTGSQ